MIGTIILSVLGVIGIMAVGLYYYFKGVRDGKEEIMVKILKGELKVK